MKARVWSVLLVVAIAGAGFTALGVTPAGAIACTPNVTNMSPTVGFTTGGTTVTLTGTCFNSPGNVTAVDFGGTNGTALHVASDTSLTVNSPSGSPGPVTVTAHGPGGTGAAGTQFTYVAPPTVTGIVPAKGPQGGGTSVVVTGNHFAPAGSSASVKFGPTAATSVSGVSNTSLTAVSPAEAPGPVNLTVTVTLSSGEAATSTDTATYTFVPAPIVTSVSPTSGPVAGGTDVTITGANFQPGAAVFFGPFDGTAGSCPDPSTKPPLCSDSSAIPIDVLSSTSILATTRAGIVGATNVVVLNPDGQHGALTSGSAGHYSFTGTAPSITTPLSPTSGSSLGGTVVTINGHGFLPSASVTFRTTVDAHPASATAVTVNAGGTQLTATTGAHPAALVNVIVAQQGGATATAVGAYTYNAATAPAVSSTSTLAVLPPHAPVTPGTGTALGGTQVTIHGANFVSGAQVTFGGNPSPSAAVLNSTTISAVAPGHPSGTVAVAVVNPDQQTSSPTTSYVYTAPPTALTITSILPTSGDGGTSVTINGTGFANTNGGTTNAASPANVRVGAHICIPGDSDPANVATCLRSLPPPPPPAVAPPIVVSDTKIQGLVPNAPGGAATVTVTNPDGHTATVTFTYTGPTGAPTLTSVTSGSPLTTLGNTTVTLAGTNFVTGAVVTFITPCTPPGPCGSSKAKSTAVVSGNSITAVTPAGIYGLVDVTVTNPGGAVATLKNAITFTTANQPTITNVNPVSGPSGTTVTITGTGFAHTSGGSPNSTTDATVSIGGRPLLSLPTPPPHTTPPAPVVVSDTTITGVLPTAPGGSYDVAVLNPDGQGVILVNGYAYPSDAIPPTTTATATKQGGGSYTFGTWATAHVTVTLTATDNVGGSGVASITYSATGAQATGTTTVTGSSTSISFTVQGTTVLTYHATDIAGNVEGDHTATIMVDTVSPTLTSSAATLSGPYTAGTTTGQDVTVTFTCNDATSGVATLSATDGVTTTSGASPLAFTESNNGTGQSVTGTCTDTAGNTSTSTFSPIDITKTAPTITASATIGGLPYTAGVWTNEAVTVTFSCTPLSADNQIVSLTSPVQVSGPETNRTVTGSCTDYAGNTSSITFGTATAGIDIDLTLPIATATATTTDNLGHTVTYTANTWTNHNVIVTFHCTDSGTNQSGVNTIDPPVTLSAEGKTSGVVGGCTDIAGNSANPPAFFGPILIDKTAPVCGVVLTPNPIHPATRQLTSVHATVTVTDGASGANGFKLVSITSNSPATAAADIVGFTLGTASVNGQLRATFGRAYTFTYQGFDVAGNASALCTTTVNVTYF